jgi:hypothetical protein
LESHPALIASASALCAEAARGLHHVVEGSRKVRGSKTSGWTSTYCAENEKALVAQGLSGRAGDRARTGDVQLGKRKKAVSPSRRKSKKKP